MELRNATVVVSVIDTFLFTLIRVAISFHRHPLLCD